MNSSDKPNGTPFIAEGGVPYATPSTRDPFEARDDLMTVVEALTPTWPSREAMKESAFWLL
ncbi:MAG TPA: hypothetical protein VK629_13545 [Steroidobacteraceae bacterium]|nr:hypothetical protein [Steroidobacteraceae bacterium]